MTLAMLAGAFLVVVALFERTPAAGASWVVELTCSEIRWLLAAMVGAPAGGAAHRLCWSWWRRRHQARARAGHYRRQAAQQP